MIINILENFSFHTQWNAGILLFSLLSIVFYLFLLPSSASDKTWKIVLSIVGFLLIFLTVGSPLNIIGRIMFSGHIIQMLLLLFVAAPLLVVGTKTAMIELGCQNKFVKRMITFMIHPTFSIPVFHLLFAGYHIPAVFDYVRVSYFLNYFYLLCLFVAALILWFPILSPVKTLDLLPSRNKSKYAIVNGCLFVPLIILLLFSNEILYSIYIDPDLILSSLEVCLPSGESIEIIPEDLLELLLPFPPLREQQVGGIILLVSQSVLFGGIAILFSKKLVKSKK